MSVCHDNEAKRVNCYAVLRTQYFLLQLPVASVSAVVKLFSTPFCYDTLMAKATMHQ
jgi:hypothetical protein